MNHVFFMMQKDEHELLRPWMDYHLRLTTPDCIYVYDNGSTDVGVISDLLYAEEVGINVDYSHSTREDFEGKGEIFLDLYRRLQDTRKDVEFFFPLDCDEFIVVPGDDGLYTSDPRKIREHLEDEVGHTSRPENFRVRTCHNNVPGRSDAFSEAPHKKVFLGRSATLTRMDTGYHRMVRQEEEDDLFIPTAVSYLHFHNRNYASLLKSSRAKLSYRVPDFQVSTLKKYWENNGRGRHLVKYFENDETWYYNRFESKLTTTVDCERWFREIGHEQPYSSVIASDSRQVKFLKNPSNIRYLPPLERSALSKKKFPDETLLISTGNRISGTVIGNSAYSEAQGWGWRPCAHTENASTRYRDGNADYRVDAAEGAYKVAVMYSGENELETRSQIMLNQQIMRCQESSTPGLSVWHAVAHADEGALVFRFPHTWPSPVATILAITPYEIPAETAGPPLRAPRLIQESAGEHMTQDGQSTSSEYLEGSTPHQMLGIIEGIARNQERLLTEIADLKASMSKISYRVTRIPLESANWIQPLVEMAKLSSTPTPLSPFTNFSIRPQDGLQLAAFVAREQPSTILECGSGMSSVWLGQALRLNGSGRLISLEHEEEFYIQSRELVKACGLSDIVDVRFAPLEPVSLQGSLYRWYDKGAMYDLEAVDMLLVDGPPGSTGDRARLPALPMLADKLVDGATVILDDCNRPTERDILEIWQREFKMVGLDTSPPNERKRTAWFRYRR